MPCRLAAVLTVFVAGTAAAQERLPPDLLQRFGGRYATDCAQPGATALVVQADALLVEHKGQRLTGRKVQAAYSYYGNSPPPNYQVALLSEVRPSPGMDLVFTVFSDRRGPYIALDAGDKLVPVLGRPVLAARFRHCDKGAAGPAPQAPRPSAAAAAATSPGELLRDPAFAGRLRQSLGPLARERWIARLEGPAPQLREVTLAGTAYQLAAVCKPHDCQDNNLVLVWRAQDQQLLGKVLRGGQTVWIGGPTPAQQTALERLWRAEWRGGK